MSAAASVLPGRRDLRLASGLVLFAYVALHLVCHAVGLVSLDQAEAALRATVRVWHSVPGTVALYGAAAVHVGLALLAVYDRRTLRMPPLQALRIVLGLAMPIALIGHFVGTRYAFERFGLSADYARVAGNLWNAGSSGLALGLLAPGWLHGCLGLRFAFAARRGWQRWRFALFAAALLLPVLAALGFVTMGRELVALRAIDAVRAVDGAPAVEEARRAGEARRSDEARAVDGSHSVEEARVADRMRSAAARPTAAQGAAIGDMRDDALDVYLGLIALVAAARWLRTLDEKRRRAVVRIRYPARSVSVPRGWTVLEASRSFGIPHPSICGGRPRCTTCRVRVVDGAAHCPPPGRDEQRLLERIDAAGVVRLACQLRPTDDIGVEPVLAVEPARWRRSPPTRPTRERRVVVLFAEVDVRALARGVDVDGPTRRTVVRAPAGEVNVAAPARGVEFGASTREVDVAAPARPAPPRVPAHDLLYALGRFHTIAAPALAAADGLVVRQTGQHWMALVGLDDRVEAAAQKALGAARTLEEDWTALARRLGDELGLDAGFTIGLHAGSAVVGSLGEGNTKTVSAVGEAVDSALRLLQAAPAPAPSMPGSIAIRGTSTMTPNEAETETRTTNDPGTGTGARCRFVLSAAAAAASGLDAERLTWRTLDLAPSDAAAAGGSAAPLAWATASAAALAAIRPVDADARAGRR